MQRKKPTPIKQCIMYVQQQGWQYEGIHQGSGFHIFSQWETVDGERKERKLQYTAGDLRKHYRRQDVPRP